MSYEYQVIELKVCIQFIVHVTSIVQLYWGTLLHTDTEFIKLCVNNKRNLVRKLSF